MSMEQSCCKHHSEDDDSGIPMSMTHANMYGRKQGALVSRSDKDINKNMTPGKDTH